MGFPTKVQIQTISLCNYACTMCPYPETSAGKVTRRLEWGVFDSIVEQIGQQEQVVMLCLMLQNEPLLDKRFIDFVERADRCPTVGSISTVTNGSPLSATLLDRLCSYDKLRLTISINAVSRGRYLAVHGQDRFDRIHQLLRSWKGPRERITLSCVATSEPGSEAIPFVGHWRALGYSTRTIPVKNRASERDRSNAVHGLDEAFGHCTYPVDTMTILANGDVIPCCQDWSGRTSFGNVSRRSMAEIWNDPELRAFREAAIAGEIREFPGCRDCDHPMRSSTSAELERQLDPEYRPPIRRIGDFSSHAVRIHRQETESTAVVVGIDAPGVLRVMLGDPAPDEEPVEIILPLAYSRGHEGLTIRCRGTLVRDGARATTGRYEPHRVILDPGDPAHRFWSWYRDDWTHPTDSPPSRDLHPSSNHAESPLVTSSPGA